MIANSQYINQLTWLRGIAALLVVSSHVVYATQVAYNTGNHIDPFVPLKAADMGDMGVILFFVLSGTTLYISNNNVLTSFPSYFAKRFFRIWPAFAVSLLAYILFAVVFKLYYVEPQGHWIEKQFLAQYTLKDVFAYLTLTSNIFGEGGLYNVAFWSLPVEFDFYLLFPLILLLLSRLGIIGPIALGGFLVFINHSLPIPEQSSAFLRLAYGFCGGVVLGYLYQRTTIRFSGWFALITLPTSYALAVAVAHQILPMPSIPFFDEIYNVHVIFAFAFVGIFMFSDIKLPERFRRWLELYGRISYSTYLYHNLVIGFLTLLMIRVEINNGLLRYLVMFVCTLILTQKIALLSYEYIELRSITFGRTLFGKKPQKQL